MDRELISDLQEVSKILFDKDFFEIFHGSISARVELNKFVINKEESIMGNLKEEDFILLNHAKDFRYKIASVDASIHSKIYESIPDAKFIAYTMPPFTTAYSLQNALISPADYFGKEHYPLIKVYDPKSYDDWFERADFEIAREMIDSRADTLVIKGYGIYAYARELGDLARKLSIIEKSCQLLLYTNSNTP